MKIAIDISQIAYAGSGVGRYTETVVRSLLKYDSKNEYTFFYASLRQPLPEDLKNELAKKGIVKEYKLPPTFLELLWNKLHVLPIEFFVGKQDIVITSDWTEPPSKSKKITILHDVVIYKYPQTSHAKTEFDVKQKIISANIVEVHKRKLKWVVKESTMIICDSESTKNDAKEILNIEDNRMKVVYPAVNPKKSTVEEIKKTIQKFKLEKPFILSVGKIEPRKNIRVLIEAYKHAQLKNIELIIVGKLGWEEKQLMQNSQNVRFLGFVTDTELSALYASCLFFIFPSLYEGFGLPLIEAMSAGAATACSNNSSLKELGEDVSRMFDPTNTQEITDTIKILASDEKLRKISSEKGERKAKEFTEERFAKQLLSIIESL